MTNLKNFVIYLKISISKFYMIKSRSIFLIHFKKSFTANAMHVLKTIVIVLEYYHTLVLLKITFFFISPQQNCYIVFTDVFLKICICAQQISKKNLFGKKFNCVLQKLIKVIVYYLVKSITKKICTQNIYNLILTYSGFYYNIHSQLQKTTVVIY